MNRKGQNPDFPKAFFSIIFCHFSVKHVSMRYRQIEHGQQNTDPTSISIKTASNLWSINTIHMILAIIQAKKLRFFCRHFNPKTLYCRWSTNRKHRVWIEEYLLRPGLCALRGEKGISRRVRKGNRLSGRESGKARTIGQKSQESRRKCWATRLSVRSLAHSLAHSLPSLWESVILMSHNQAVLSHSGTLLEG